MRQLQALYPIENVSTMPFDFNGGPDFGDASPPAATSSTNALPSSAPAPLGSSSSGAKASEEEQRRRQQVYQHNLEQAREKLARTDERAVSSQATLVLKLVPKELADEREFGETFANFGHVREVRFIQDNTNFIYCLAFVKFSSRRDVEHALASPDYYSHLYHGQCVVLRTPLLAAPIAVNADARCTRGSTQGPATWPGRGLV